MNKTFKKSVMTRSRLNNKYLKNRTTENFDAYKKQRNLCVKLFRKEKKAFYSNLQPLTKILRQIADLQQKLTFQAIWKVLIFSLEMTRLLKIEKWLEASALGCHSARNGHLTH